MSLAYHVIETQIAAGDLQCGSHTHRKDQMGQCPQATQVYSNSKTFRPRRSLWFEGARRVPRVLWDDERGHDDVSDEGHESAVKQGARPESGGFGVERDHCVWGLRDGRRALVEVADVDCAIE